MTYQDYQRRELLKTIGIWVATWTVIIGLAIGYLTMLNRANVKIEARCLAQGGQVIVTPGEVSRCLLPPTR
jgi:acyl-coenzyme A thioesterase PaaI-like protein